MYEKALPVETLIKRTPNVVYSTKGGKLFARVGDAKREILARVFATGCDPSLPASWLLRHPRVRLWADDAALGVAVAAR